MSTELMKDHPFIDSDVEKVLSHGDTMPIEIVLRERAENSLVLSKRDVVALARVYGMIAFDRDSEL